MNIQLLHKIAVIREYRNMRKLKKRFVKTIRKEVFSCAWRGIRQFKFHEGEWDIFGGTNDLRDFSCKREIVEKILEEMYPGHWTKRGDYIHYYEINF